MPSSAFAAENPPVSIDNWVRYAKINQETGNVNDLVQPQAAVVCSQAENLLRIRTYNYRDFDQGFNKDASPIEDDNQIFKAKDREFPDMYGLSQHGDNGEFTQISCLAALKLNKEDNSFYGKYAMESGTTFLMANGE
jgi:hypothetical protein